MFKYSEMITSGYMTYDYLLEYLKKKEKKKSFIVIFGFYYQTLQANHALSKLLKPNNTLKTLYYRHMNVAHLQKSVVTNRSRISQVHS